MPPIQFGSLLQLAGTAPSNGYKKRKVGGQLGSPNLRTSSHPIWDMQWGANRICHRRVSTRTPLPRRTVPFVSLRDLRICARDTKWNFHAQPGHALETSIRTAAQRLSKCRVDTCQRWFDGWPLWEDGHRPSQHRDRTDGRRLRVPPLHPRTAQHRRLGTVSC